MMTEKFLNNISPLEAGIRPREYNFVVRGPTTHHVNNLKVGEVILQMANTVINIL